MKRLTKGKITLLVGLVTAAMALALAGACGGGDDDADPTATARPAAATPTPTTAAAMTEDEDTDDMMETTEATMMEAPEFTGSFAWTGAVPSQFNEAPMLAARVAAGELPKLEDRLPVAEDVLVIPVVEEIGEYGGTWRRGFSGPGDGQNMDRVMMDHPLMYDLDGATILPNLLKDWEISADGLTYTFKLRRGMKWSDGEPFTADDFIWANENIVRNEKLNPKKEGRLGFSTYGPVLRKIDDATFTASFTEPQAGFLDEMATYRIAGYTLNGRVGAPLFAPAHFLEQFHEDFADMTALESMIEDEGFENWETFFKNKIDVHKTAESPNVGAWIVTKPNTGETWEFERNPYFYAVDPAGNQLPYIDKIEARLYSDNEVHNLRGIAGEYDFNHRAIEFAKLPVFKENEEKGNYRMILWPGDATLAVSFNYSYGLGDVTETPDPEIRKWLTHTRFKQGMSHAINRPRINELLYFGTGLEIQPTFPTWSAHYPGEEIAKRYTQYDPALASQILDEVGLTEKDSEGFRLRTDGSGDRLTFELTYTSGWTPTNNPAELLKESWAAVGIDVRLKQEEGKLSGERRGGNVQQIHLDGDVNAREPTGLISGRSAFPAYSNWYSQRSGSYTLGAVVAEPDQSDTAMWRLVELSDEAAKLRYVDRTANYIENQDITSEHLYYIGLIGHTASANGTIVVKNNFRNVPDPATNGFRAPNASALQNPGSGRTVQFFFKGGLNDAGY